MIILGKMRHMPPDDTP